MKLTSLTLGGAIILMPLFGASAEESPTAPRSICGAWTLTSVDGGIVWPVIVPHVSKGSIVHIRVPLGTTNNKWSFGPGTDQQSSAGGISAERESLIVRDHWPNLCKAGTSGPWKYVCTAPIGSLLVYVGEKSDFPKPDTYDNHYVVGRDGQFNAPRDGAIFGLMNDLRMTGAAPGAKHDDNSGTLSVEYRICNG